MVQELTKTFLLNLNVTGFLFLLYAHCLIAIKSSFQSSLAELLFIKFAALHTNTTTDLVRESKFTRNQIVKK